MEHLTTLDAQEGVPTVYNRFDCQSPAYYIQYTLIITITKKIPAEQQPPNHKSYKIDFLWIRKSVLVEVDGGQEEAFTYFLVGWIKKVMMIRINKTLFSNTTIFWEKRTISMVLIIRIMRIIKKLFSNTTIYYRSSRLKRTDDQALSTSVWSSGAPRRTGFQRWSLYIIKYHWVVLIMNISCANMFATSLLIRSI